MNAFVLHDTRDETGALRWGTSATLVAAAHIGMIALFLAWYTQRPSPGVALPAIMVDMVPSSAPQPTQVDIAPGPQMLEAADASPPPEPAKQEIVEEQLAPTPPQLKPEVEAPPEQKTQPTPPKPEPAKIIPDRPKPVPAKPRPVRAEAKKPSESTPAPRTSAAPPAERLAPAASAMSAGAVASALATYKQQVAAHLQRFKQYPAAAGGARGVSRLSFSLGRSGQVLGSGLSGSSGNAALDAEALATVRRAQPFPSMPPEITANVVPFAVPLSFMVR